MRTAPPADRVASEFADAAKRRIPLAERGFAGVQPAEESTLEDWWRLVDQSPPERATLGLSDLTATQDSVADNFAAVAAANQGRRPVVIEEGGRRYIIDGHHRALAAPDGRLDVDLYRSNWTPPGEAAPQPQAMPRLLGRARDGSVLPMREPQPFRRTEARSADLVEAARPTLPMDEASRMARAREMGFDLDTPLYHGRHGGEIEGGSLRPSKRSGFPEPTGVSLSQSPDTAAQFGDSIYPAFARGKIGDATAFMRRARELMAEHDMPEWAASAMTQREFEADGFTGVRWGPRETTVFRSENLRSPHAAFDPARRGESDLLASWGGLAALPAGAEVARRRGGQRQ